MYVSLEHSHQSRAKPCEGGWNPNTFLFLKSWIVWIVGGVSFTGLETEVLLNSSVKLSLGGVSFTRLINEVWLRLVFEGGSSICLDNEIRLNSAVRLVIGSSSRAESPVSKEDMNRTRGHSDGPELDFMTAELEREGEGEGGERRGKGMGKREGEGEGEKFN